MKESARILVLFEEMSGKFDAILEYVKDIPDIKRRVTRLEVDMEQVKSDLTVIKFGLKVHSQEIAELKARG